MSRFADDLENEIKSAYKSSGNQLGWRLLYSPPSVLDGAEVAFLGLNPGGANTQPEQAEFAMTRGSAYVNESWKGAIPGKSKLQTQVTALFQRLGVQPENVLAGNIVPFRSPSWKALKDREHAIDVGRSIWSQILEHSQPRLIIAMGSNAFAEALQITGASNCSRHSLGWGRIKGTRADFDRGNLIGLPHLSRFSVITRERSQPGLSTLFQNWLSV